MLRIHRSDFATMAVIVPSRGRPHNIEELKEAWKETDTQSDLWVVCDHDDPQLKEYEKIAENLMVFRRESKGMATPLNKAAQKLIREKNYTYFAFIGDDHRPRTLRWDQMWMDILGDRGGLVYGNDLFQGENIPTAVGMTATVVKALDGMVPPGFIHLYLDNFWLKLGQDIGRIFYLPDCIIEHCHPLLGKANVDEGYIRVNSEEMYAQDKARFEEYIASREYRELVMRLK